MQLSISVHLAVLQTQTPPHMKKIPGLVAYIKLRAFYCDLLDVMYTISTVTPQSLPCWSFFFAPTFSSSPLFTFTTVCPYFIQTYSTFTATFCTELKKECRKVLHLHPPDPDFRQYRHQSKMSSAKKLTCKGTLRQVFIRVYRLEIQTVMLYFRPSFVNCCHSNLLTGSTLSLTEKGADIMCYQITMRTCTVASYQTPRFKMPSSESGRAN